MSHENEKYIEKVLQKIYMDNAKVVSTPFTNYFKLIIVQYHSTGEEEREMQQISYASAVESLMYAMCVLGEIWLLLLVLSAIICLTHKKNIGIQLSGFYGIFGVLLV